MTEQGAKAIISEIKMNYAENGEEECSEALDMAINALEKQKHIECMLEKAAEEIENIYGRETELSEEIRDLLDCLNLRLVN
ncbi:MAG: hypothetical protein MR992_00300 [Lachnospiraceae bacterium]|nr:hypothetical protein [Lachnospiraceae bacterium]MDD7627824.1 hypothetical protein [Lachnospiraceae bacterium]MDY4118782.1 hypothetical protein [Lachnospiraceae bacterium]